MAKTTRKELLRQQDAFITAASASANWMSTNRKHVVIGGVGTVVAIAAIWGGTTYIEREHQRMARLYGEALEILAAEVNEEGSSTLDADERVFPTEEAKNEAARDAFVRVADEATISDVGLLAGFYVADLNEKIGKKEEAERGFDELVEKMSPGSSLYFLAVERSAYLKEARGDFSGAIERLRLLEQDAHDFFDDYALYHQARLYVTQGEKEEARKLLERLKEAFPESALRATAESLVASADASGEKGATSAGTPADEAEELAASSDETASPAHPESDRP